MKKICTTILLLACGLTASAQINFEKASWDKIKAKAKAEKKLIFVDVYTTWCGPCKMLDSQVFSNRELGHRMNAFFVSYKADAESHGRSLAAQFGVNAYPTGLFLDADGNLLHKFIGFKPVPEFANEANVAIQTTENGQLFTLYETAFEQGNRTPELVYTYLKFRRVYGLPTHDLLETVLKKMPQDSLLLPHWQQTVIENTQWAEGRGFAWLLTQKQRPNLKNKLEFIISNTVQKAHEEKDRKLFQNTLPYLDSIQAPEVARELKTRYTMSFASVTKSYDQLADAAEQYLEQEIIPVLAANSRETSPETYQKAIDQLTNVCWMYSEYVKKDRLTKVCDCVAKVIEKEKNPVLLSHYASLLYKQGDYDSALAAQTQAVELARGANHDNLGDYEEKLKRIRKKKL
ncbi:MAG: thioredoxin family protein [Bacteroidetes bacterium]|nr:thioredoxin family protein [Bacteroidota bacterium]